MSSHAHSHEQHDHGHGHGHAHDHPHSHGHAHAHAPSLPHPPMVLPPSFMRFSIGTRLGVALFASAVLWCAVWLAMR